MNAPVHPTPPAAPPLWRTYLALLLPMLLTNALQLAAGTLDNIYLGQLLGPQAVAAAAAFFPVFFLLLALVMGLATGAMVLIGQAWGAHRPQQARAVAGSAVALILLLSVLVMAVGGGVAPRLLTALGTPAPILGESIVYARVLLLAAPAFFLLWLATAVSRAVGDAKTPLQALLLATLIGLLCTPLLILGWAGLPRQGAASAAVSAALASLLVLGWLLWRWRRIGHPLAPGRELLRAIRFDGVLIRSMLRIGLPSSLQMLSLAIAEIVLLAWINRYGYTATAAYGAVNQLMSWVQLPAMSLGITATILAAHAVGAGRTARLPAIARTGVLLGLATLGMVVVLVVVLAPGLTGLILAATEVRELAASQLRTVVWGVLAMGGSAVLVGVMRGSGTVWRPALLGMMAVVLVELPLAMWLQARHGLAGLWWAWPLGLAAMLVMQVMCFARWRRVHAG
ncbi:MATE family efflux transporter [Mesorhizobium sp. M00.F.Ca.ET.151.01.1.1]|nr:MATE family efflux transporter [bacterium M00.F.Ca.ET.199.01.1.1]TGT09394.1 MATE family efflux transporter [bacterium M00.F.Ca.ET.177.01.1.1]TGT67329.1 MATE family efflux transporter [Mesorhizobium sp. M00.F.Ca.ET.170.01.1.1]TGU16239.1 MATE family efflux transporter [bacterium M00.F.Ca.ET.163.01.1.1]TGU98969.1 MATE family efflux transporter [Mesorhizobium sp. M00.F.Ca.ET.151.01.1.1]TGV60632.1 MATE family efflux transporter [bacterium M00.F.Ca.ET.141.01.1.1]